MSAFDKTTEEAVAARDGGKGSNVLIALKLYEAGGGSVESLTKDWELNEHEAALLMTEIKRGWSEGHFQERRHFVERREGEGRQFTYAELVAVVDHVVCEYPPKSDAPLLRESISKAIGAL